MGFIDDLKKGFPGIRFAIPDTFQVHEEQERRVVLVDNERKVGWHVLHAPWRLDLRPENDAALNTDVLRQSRHTFEEQYHQLAQLFPKEQLPQRLPPRTQDPQWSPVISVERVQIGSAAALEVIRRVAYEPSIEVVVGSLLIPLASGLAEIAVFHRNTDNVGSRESMMLQMAMLRYPGEEVPQLARRLGQTFFDDPAEDAKFPSSPLSLVRSALRWLRAGGEELLAVTSPMGNVLEGEASFPSSGCAIKIPPRYLPLPPRTVPVPRTMAVLTRVMLEASENPRMLDVFMLPDVILDPKLPAEERKRQLLELARRNAGEWEAQGATNVTVEVGEAQGGPAAPGRVLVSSLVKMVVNGVPSQALARWVGDEDGHVFRLAIGAPQYIPREELESDLDIALSGFRRVAPESGPWLTSDVTLRPKKTVEETLKKAAEAQTQAQAT